MFCHSTWRCLLLPCLSLLPFLSLFSQILMLTFIFLMSKRLFLRVPAEGRHEGLLHLEYLSSHMISRGEAEQSGFRVTVCKGKVCWNAKRRKQRKIADSTTIVASLYKVGIRKLLKKGKIQVELYQVKFNAKTNKIHENSNKSVKLLWSFAQIMSKKVCLHHFKKINVELYHADFISFFIELP